MQTSVTRKNKIVLSDYNYQLDIENRLLMANLTLFEVEVLQEIINHSLKISIKGLADEMDVSVDALKAVLPKLCKTKLFKYDAQTIEVDKEVRKYYEFQMEKFDEDFKPNLDFLQNILNKVPMPVLLDWYAIPRGSDNIFASIVEKNLLTPKIYRAYLDEIEFENPILKKMIKDLYESPDLKIYTSVFIEKYGLSREQCEEYLLLLEYHLVCCLNYEKVENEWTEVVAPFFEWNEYLQFEKASAPPSITDEKEITIVPFEAIKLSAELTDSSLYTPRNLHEIEKVLTTIRYSGWVLIDDFIKSFTAPIGDNDPVTLKNRGKRWNYIIPHYTASEKKFVKHAILQYFAQQKLISTGLYKGKDCFCLTPLGKMTIHE